jgi:acetyl esterase/lipase
MTDVRFAQKECLFSRCTIAGLLLLSVCASLYSQDATEPNKRGPSPLIEKDVPYADGGDQQMLDLYLPGSKGFTTVVFTFGGGWHSGGRKSVTRIGEQLQSAGYACALPSHRLAPKHKFPAQAEDIGAAFAWVRNNIGSKGGNSKRVILMGHSSGAHLSLLIATDPKYLAKYKLSPSDIAGVVGLSTPVDLEPRGDKKGFGDALMAGKGADVFSRDTALMRAASPIQHVSKTLPPTLLVVGERDFPMLDGDAQAFAKKATGAGREVTTFIGKGLDHMGVVRSLLEDRSPVRDRVLAFLEKRGQEAGAE